MKTFGQEIQARFYMRGIGRSKARREKWGLQLAQERVLESNLRFDLPGACRRAEGRVLRLRRDTSVRLTYKSASQKPSESVRPTDRGGPWGLP